MPKEAPTEKQLDAAAQEAGNEIKEAALVKIKLPKIEGAQDPQEVIINGYMWRIKRGEEVEVPEGVVEVLKNADIL